MSQRHNIKRKAALAFLASIVFFSLSTSFASAKCLPLLVFYGGAFDSKSEIVKRLARDFKRNSAGQAVIEYYAHDEENVSHSFVQRHLIEYPKSPIGLIGHSYGGDTAYGVAKDWEDQISILVTLDAVGGRAFRAINVAETKRHLSKPNNVETWINVYKKYGLFGAEYVGEGSQNALYSLATSGIGMTVLQIRERLGLARSMRETSISRGIMRTSLECIIRCQNR